MRQSALCLWRFLRQDRLQRLGRKGEIVMWEPQTRYPDADVISFDKSFDRFRVLGGIEKLYSGCRWAEGPVWFGDQRVLLWSDIPNNRILRWSEQTGQTDEFRRPSNNANGNYRDHEGRLITCEHLTRRVTRTEHSGAITVLADSYQGKRLNSPNDVIVASDGAIWFTDPPFGIAGFYEGEKAEAELVPAVYRLDPSGTLDVVEDAMPGPNGLAFSPDESILYVVGRKLTNRRTLINAGPGGTPDGFRVDIEGNLWCGWGMGTEALDGVRVFTPSGEPIGHIKLPERCANLTFGGRHRNRLFMAASRSLYALYVNTQGLG
jgi:gluconolactonase